MPPVERGLEVLALVFLVVVRLREGSVEMEATTRGLELPVVLRVEAIVDRLNEAERRVFVSVRWISKLTGTRKFGLLAGKRVCCGMDAARLEISAR